MATVKQFPKFNYLLHCLIKLQTKQTPDAEYNPKFVVEEEYWPTMLDAVGLEKSLSKVNFKIIDLYIFGSIPEANRLIETHSLQDINVFMHVFTGSDVLKNMLFDY